MNNKMKNFVYMKTSHQTGMEFKIHMYIISMVGSHKLQLRIYSWFLKKKKLILVYKIRNIIKK
jgi:hypothetical protein